MQIATRVSYIWYQHIFGIILAVLNSGSGWHIHYFFVTGLGSVLAAKLIPD